MENSRRTRGIPFAILMVVLFAGVLMGVSGCIGPSSSDAVESSDEISTMADWFASLSISDLRMERWLAEVLSGLIKCILLINVVAVGALVFIWLERKIAGRIQDRLGPTRVGGRFGWLQTLADGLKLIAKEDITPKGADRMLFKLAPYIAFAASYAAFLALPFANGWVAQNINVAVFFILAVLGLEVFGVILAGYASGSKWSLFGCMREAAQVVSYEVPLGLCVVVPVMICGTMNLVTIADMQAGWFTNWLVFHDPFTFIIFWVYFTCGVASVNRAPFDLAEAESELVAGFHTEYSGLRWSVFFMAEYGSMFMVSGLATILFFGGWNGPIPIFHMIGWADGGGFTAFLATLAGCMNFVMKSVVWVIVMMWVRWTLPRLRIDQVITTCLKYCVPVAAVGFLGAVFWQVADLPSPSDIAPVKSLVIDTRTGEPVIDPETGKQKIIKGMGGVREYWLLHSRSSANEPSQAGEGSRPDESAQSPPLESKKGGDG